MCSPAKQRARPSGRSRSTAPAIPARAHHVSTTPGWHLPPNREAPTKRPLHQIAVVDGRRVQRQFGTLFALRARPPRIGSVRRGEGGAGGLRHITHTAACVRS
eukprot:2576476-Prymnesium_polylepis.1